MNAKSAAFIEFFDNLVSQTGAILPKEVEEYYEMIKNSQSNVSSKPLVTEAGLPILEFLQTCETKSVTAKIIAESLTFSSRKVSGAMRKLASDGYVEKFGSNPVVYSLTEKGKEFNVNEYKSVKE